MPSAHSPRHWKALVAISALAVLTAACSSDSSPVAPSTPSVTMPPPAETPAPPPTPPPSSVRYRLVFDGLWTQQSHPEDYPGNPHFSPLIGGTHTAAVRFWGEGLTASDGIRRMAEQGFTSPLDAHVNDAIAAGSARDLVRGTGIALSPAAVSIEFEVHQTHPLLTLVSMVAPSPDWFVGVDSLPLFANGQWADRLVIDLRPWDAGTDGGRSYESADLPLTPRQPIALLTAPPVAVNGVAAPMARFTITRL